MGFFIVNYGMGDKCLEELKGFFLGNNAVLLVWLCVFEIWKSYVYEISLIFVLKGL